MCLEKVWLAVLCRLAHGCFPHASPPPPGSACTPMVRLWLPQHTSTLQAEAQDQGQRLALCTVFRVLSYRRRGDARAACRHWLQAMRALHRHRTLQQHLDALAQCEAALVEARVHAGLHCQGTAMLMLRQALTRQARGEMAERVLIWHMEVLTVGLAKHTATRLMHLEAQLQAHIPLLCSPRA